MDKRQSPRHYVSLPIEYQVSLQDSVDSWSSQAVLKNISLGGLYFVSDGPPSLQPGNVADFVFKFLHGNPNPLITREIRGKGMVKRVVPPNERSPNFGVAVEFLSGPLFV
jgi:hypothetical protein